MSLQYSSMARGLLNIMSQDQESAKKRVYFRLKDDLVLVRSSLARNPWENPPNWEAVRLDVCKSLHVDSLRTIRERMELLIKSFKREDRLRKSKSGTEEEYDEMSQMLTEVISLKEDVEMERIKTKKKKEEDQEKDQKKVTEILEKSMNTLGKQTKSPQSSPSKKRLCKRGNFLEEYLTRKIELEERKFALEERKWNAMNPKKD
ncbi:unnamed protein product [Owenia fusiformis]|uniref:Uncharacterized protein n=1 Tax=Owenia fusiformis TaxID=6347 RepID=A0A8S4NZU9_OWEFU|nr:unnamed protein product [Owenia fusiformis]